MFKTNSLDRIREFDVHAQVIRIQFELIAIGERLVFLDIHGESCDCASDI